MSVQQQQPVTPLAEEPLAAMRSIGGHLRELFKVGAASPQRKPLVMLLGGIVAVVLANAIAQVQLNSWYKPFYNALQKHDVNEFLHQLLIFLAIVAVLLVLVVAQTWLQQMLQVKLREWLTDELLDQWLRPKRVYTLPFAGEIGNNPDQRLQQDTKHLTELSATLFIGLLQATLLLVSFVGVLWVLSSEVVFNYDGKAFTIPGYMVWCAVAYALTGSFLTWKVGRPLIPLNAECYSREAEFRYALVRINDHGEGIALHGGEADERHILNGSVDRLMTIMRQLANGVARLTWVTSGYGWLAIVAPIVVAAPGYFGSGMTLGGLMVVVGAFNQVQTSLRWFVDNFSQIADWQATLIRVVTFRDSLVALDTLGHDCDEIDMVEAADGPVVFDDLAVSFAEGQAALSETYVEVAAGERMLIVGNAGTGKSTLLRAMAGMWPWGAGRISLPPRSTIMFLPQRPYLPLGTLREAVAYPKEPGTFEDAAVHAALARVGLGRVIDSLDRGHRWENDLSIEEQQRLAFARVLLNRPKWVFLDEALGALDADSRRDVLGIFDEELKETTVIAIGRDTAQTDFHKRVAHLVRRPGGTPLRLHHRGAVLPVPS